MAASSASPTNQPVHIGSSKDDAGHVRARQILFVGFDKEVYVHPAAILEESQLRLLRADAPDDTCYKGDASREVGFANSLPRKRHPWHYTSSVETFARLQMGAYTRRGVYPQM